MKLINNALMYVLTILPLYLAMSSSASRVLRLPASCVLRPASCVLRLRPACVLRHAFSVVVMQDMVHQPAN